MTIPIDPNTCPFAFGDNIVAAVNHNTSLGNDTWTHGATPFTGDPDADAQQALANLGEYFNRDPNAYQVVRREDWGTYVYEVIKR